MTKQEEIREGIDKVICNAEDPDIPYEEQSAPMLDWSWSVTQRILKYLHSQGVVIKKDMSINEFERLNKIMVMTTDGEFEYVAVEPLIKEVKSENN